MTETIHDLSGLRNSGYGVVQSGGAVVMDGGAEGVVTGTGTVVPPASAVDLKKMQINLYTQTIDFELPNVEAVSKYFDLKYFNDESKEVGESGTEGVRLSQKVIAYSMSGTSKDGNISFRGINRDSYSEQVLSNADFLTFMNKTVLSPPNGEVYITWNDIFGKVAWENVAFPVTSRFVNKDDIATLNDSDIKWPVLNISTTLNTDYTFKMSDDTTTSKLGYRRKDQNAYTYPSSTLVVTT